MKIEQLTLERFMTYTEMFLATDVTPEDYEDKIRDAMFACGFISFPISLREREFRYIWNFPNDVVKPGQLYQHYGNRHIYQIVGVAQNVGHKAWSSTEQKYNVIYSPILPDGNSPLYSRPLLEFMAVVLPDDRTKLVRRFTLVETQGEKQ